MGKGYKGETRMGDNLIMIDGSNGDGLVLNGFFRL